MICRGLDLDKSEGLVVAVCVAAGSVMPMLNVRVCQDGTSWDTIRYDTIRDVPNIS